LTGGLPFCRFRANFPRFEISTFSLNYFAETAATKHSPPDETNLPLPCRRPETGPLTLAQGSAASGDEWEPCHAEHHPNQRRRPAEHRAAQATSDEMCLDCIAGGDRMHAHLLFAVTMCGSYRFVSASCGMLRGGRPRHQAFLDVGVTPPVRATFAGLDLAVVPSPAFKALTALASAATRHRTDEVWRSPTSAILRKQHCAQLTSRSCEPASPNCPGASRDHQPRLYHEKSVEEVRAIIGIPQSTVKTRMFYRPQAARRTPQGRRRRDRRRLRIWKPSRADSVSKA